MYKLADGENRNKLTAGRTKKTKRIKNGRAVINNNIVALVSHGHKRIFEHKKNAYP